VRYHKIRAELLALLGGRCVECGTQSPLHVDHPKGRAYEPRELSSHTRAARYLAEARAGLVRLLCDECNGGDGETRRITYGATRKRWREYEKGA
jgi:hypothetical protein